jgi:hypothetical protein
MRKLFLFILLVTSTSFAHEKHAQQHLVQEGHKFLRWNSRVDGSRLPIGIWFEERYAANGLWTVEPVTTSAFMKPDSTESSGNEETYPRLRRRTNFSASLGGFPILADLSFGYQITGAIGAKASILSIFSPFAYQAEGFSLSGILFLRTTEHFSPYLSFGAGPLWKKEHGARSLTGAILLAQFGWNYTADVGFSASFSVGPIVSFISEEETDLGLVQLGVGWNF